jgi:hypothetical protein
VKNLKYKNIPLSKLNNEQVRELTGYFKDQNYDYDLRNLIPFELWKGEAEVNVPQCNSIWLLEQVTYLSIGRRARPINMFSLANEHLHSTRDQFRYPKAIPLGWKTSEREIYETWINSDQSEQEEIKLAEEYKSCANRVKCQQKRSPIIYGQE